MTATIERMRRKGQIENRTDLAQGRKSFVYFIVKRVFCSFCLCVGGNDFVILLIGFTSVEGDEATVNVCVCVTLTHVCPTVFVVAL